jgi:hypothetical protein
VALDRLSAKIVPIFADRRCHVVSVTDPYGRILGFLDRNLYIIFQVAAQLYLRGWVDPILDPLLLRKSGNAGNQTRISLSVAMNSEHWTIEAVSWQGYTLQNGYENHTVSCPVADIVFYTAVRSGCLDAGLRRQAGTLHILPLDRLLTNAYRLSSHSYCVNSWLDVD